MFDVDKVKAQMSLTLEHALKVFATFRAGIARADMLDSVQVEVYGQRMSIKQAATINVSDSKSLTVTPFDKSNIKAIAKSLQEANLDLGITAEATVIRITVPQMTQDRRMGLVKKLKEQSEHEKIAIRNRRRDALDELKKLKQDAKISEDMLKRFETEVQKITDHFTDEITKAVSKQEKEIMTI